MQYLIIEDEEVAARQLQKMIAKLKPGSTFLGNPDSVEAAVDWLSANPAPDLIFLDIHLADGLSFEIFEQRKVSSPIIFCTAYDQYAIKAFKLNSVDYLLKPIDPEELGAALEKFSGMGRKPEANFDQLARLLSGVSKRYKSRFLVKAGERIEAVPTEQVAFFFSEDKATLLQTADGKKYVIDFTMDETEAQLDPMHFFRLNRKYLASFDAIKSIYTYSNSRLKIVLNNCADPDILVSREKVSLFKDWLDR